MKADVAVIGAGTVGAAIAYGLAQRGARVILLDGDDSDFRAATANFGLVWSQGKGIDMPAYQELTKSSADNWPDLCADLQEVTAIDLEFEQMGGLTMCVGEAEYEARRNKLTRLQTQLASDTKDWQMIDRSELEVLLPKVTLGDGITGASFSKRDGHVNPLKLLAALHLGVVRKGGEMRSRSIVRSIHKHANGPFELEFGDDRLSADRIVIAAGLGSKALAAQVGIDLPVRPQRGQILVTERLESFLPFPTHSIRQTRDGTVMVGATHEDAGFDSSTTTKGAAYLAVKALRQFPALGSATVVRQWAGLRIMTPDSYPIYAESELCPGAFVATCHSGITLAPSHANILAAAITSGQLPQPLSAFNPGRFHVSQAA